MPFHRLYHSKDMFNADQKKEISQKITAIYKQLPEFYVVVAFLEIPEDSLFVGGEPIKDFVRIVTQHLAREYPGPDGVKIKRQVVKEIEEAVQSSVGGKEIHWEIHIEEMGRDSWKIDGLFPPMPQTEAEKLWKEKNAAVPYEE